MDPLSHALIGALVAKTARVSKRRFWIMALLGMAPDLDVVASLFGGWAAMFQHRGLSHSLVGILAQALFYAWALSRWDSGPMKVRTFHYVLPITAHVFGDLLTFFGVPLFAPFTFRQYSLDILASLNLLPLVLLVAGIWWLHHKERDGWKETRLLWGTLALYLSLCFSEKVYASKLLHDPNAVALPQTVQSLTWRAVRPDVADRTYHTYSIDLWKGIPQEQQNVPMPSMTFPVQQSFASVEVQRFLKENRWPVVRIVQQDKVWVVDWGTLMFSTQGLVRGKVRVEISDEGRLLSEKNILAFWDPATTP